MELIRVSEMERDVRREMSKIFVDGFHQWLRFFSDDKEKLARAFAHSFNTDVFYAAVIGRQLAGFAACTDGKTPSMRLSKSDFKEHLGFFKGNIAYSVLRKELEEKEYPFEIPPEMGIIEFVAVSQSHREQGVATEMLKKIHAAAPYSRYALEAADTNMPAVKLYEKLGYREFLRLARPQSSQSGVNFLVYMKYDEACEGENRNGENA